MKLKKLAARARIIYQARRLVLEDRTGERWKTCDCCRVSFVRAGPCEIPEYLCSECFDDIFLQQ